mmetsp:Transcript_10214/g.7645  ORF Transcript_10214/g.7645 Transcript_10214/m.7645 type:complete len:89 (-) Transcript_10214:26-292(-)
MSSDLMRCVAKDCNFGRARLSNADMREGDFENSNFNEATLFAANLERANLQFCTLTDTNLERANITNLRGGLERERNNAGGAVGAGDA